MGQFTKRFLEPTNDLAFKKIFQHKEALLSFLNAILGLQGELEIVDLEHLPQEQVPTLPDQIRRSVMDVRCQTRCGTIFIVEMQNHAASEFLKRSQYYASHTYVNQLSPGQGHLDLKPVVLLAIANYTVFKNDPDYVSFHKMMNEKTGASYLSDISYVFVELEKFNKSVEQCKTLQDEWIHLFKCAQDELEIPFSTPIIKGTYTQLEEARWTRDELDQYLKIRMYEVSLRATEQSKFDEGKIEGKIEVARSLHAAGVAMDIITATTGLSVNEF